MKASIVGGQGALSSPGPRDAGTEEWFGLVWHGQAGRGCINGSAAARGVKAERK
jgi:hypothetical protein